MGISKLKEERVLPKSLSGSGLLLWFIIFEGKGVLGFMMINPRI